MRPPVALLVVALTLAAATLLGCIAHGADAPDAAQERQSKSEQTSISAIRVTPPPAPAGDDTLPPPTLDDPGSPAITPSLPTDGRQAGISAADAFADVSTHPPHFSTDVNTIPPTVDVAFLTTAEVTARIDATPGRPADALLCLVTLHGAR